MDGRECRLIVQIFFWPRLIETLDPKLAVKEYGKYTFIKMKLK